MSADTTGIVRGSIAATSFADALDFLSAHPPEPTRRRLPYDYAVPTDGPASTTSVPSRRVGSGSSSAEAPVSKGPLHAALAALAAGEVTSAALVRQSLAAVDARNDDLVALVHVDAEGALAAAEASDVARAAGRPVGALEGVPLTVKDVIDVAGMPTRAASAAFDGRPRIDAVSVARLRAAGAVILGKAATHEWALGVTSPQSRNPRDSSRIPGGSSGGSAAAVGSGMGLGSLGTDTRASIRVPAALSGVVGFKATYGRVPTGGVMSLAWTMDHVAPMASTVADAALLLDVLTDDGRSLASVAPGVADLRLGVARAGFADAPPAVAAVLDRAIDALASAGATVRESDRPDPIDLATANAAGLILSRVEAAAAHRSLGLDLDLYWDEVGDQLRAAADVAGVDYLDAQRTRGQMTDRLRVAFEEHDVVVMPTSPVVAPPVDDFAGYLMLLSRNAIPWSFVGFPAMSVPCGTVDGLPVGLQLIAAPDREDLLVAVGRTVEQLRPPEM